MKKLTIYTDGASRGNPGLAACAWLILDGTDVLEAESAAIGKNTNNFAEYSAIINALKAARKYCTPNETEIEVYSDSELMILQMIGKYAVRSPKLRPKFEEAQDLAANYFRVSYTHVPRENSYISSCDWMCNQALDLIQKREEQKKLHSTAQTSTQTHASTHSATHAPTNTRTNTTAHAQTSAQTGAPTHELARPVCTPIGVVHSPYKEKGSAPKQGRFANELSVLEVYPEYAKGLRGLGEGDDIFVICWFDRSERDILEVHPHGHSKGSEPRGVFSTRAPVRPNPISLTLVKLISIDGTKLTVRGLEMLDNTPLLDIKPFYHDTDAPEKSDEL